jgi:hypothetical protein
LNTSNPPNQPNNNQNKGRKKIPTTKGKGVIHRKKTPQPGETRVGIIKIPKWTTKMANHDKGETIIFEPISLVYYATNMAITPIYATKLSITYV